MVSPSNSHELFTAFLLAERAASDIRNAVESVKGNPGHIELENAECYREAALCDLKRASEVLSNLAQTISQPNTHMVSHKEQQIPVLVRFIIDRYEDGPKGKLDEVRKVVLDYATEITTNPPEESIVTLAQYFDLVKVHAEDRYEEDEEHLADESGRDGSGEETDFGYEDRYCVELTYIARFVVNARTEAEAHERVFAMINERCEDSIDESIEHYATNLNACPAFSR